MNENMTSDELIDDNPDLANMIREELKMENPELANRPDELMREVASEIDRFLTNEQRKKYWQKRCPHDAITYTGDSEAIDDTYYEENRCDACNAQVTRVLTFSHELIELIDDTVIEREGIGFDGEVVKEGELDE